MSVKIRTTTPKGNLVIVKGGGDLATGIIHRLWRSGFPVISTEVDNPTMVRRTVSFAECLYSGHHVVEGVTSSRAEGCSVLARTLR